MKGKGFWIKETTEGNFALISSDIELNDKTLDDLIKKQDLTDEEAKECDIQIFATRELAEKEKYNKIFNHGR